MSTLVLVVSALVARWCWRTPTWSGALLVAAGVTGLLCSDADFLPLLALLVVAPMLLLAIGVTLAHRSTRDPAPDQAASRLGTLPPCDVSDLIPAKPLARANRKR